MLAFDPGDLDLGDLDHWDSENEGRGVIGRLELFRKFIPMPSSISDPRKKMDPSAVSALPFAMFNFWIENDLPLLHPFWRRHPSLSNTIETISHPPCHQLYESYRDFIIWKLMK